MDCADCTECADVEPYYSYYDQTTTTAASSPASPAAASSPASSSSSAAAPSNNDHGLPSGTNVWLSSFHGRYVGIRNYDAAVVDTSNKRSAETEWKIAKVDGKNIQAGDTVCLYNTDTGKNLEIDDKGDARTRWNDCDGTWQSLKIEKDTAGPIESGDKVYFLAHNGNNIEADPSHQTVRARWQDHGNWQRFTISKSDGYNRNTEENAEIEM